MDVLARGRRLVLIAAIAPSCFLACAGRKDDRAGIGISDRPQGRSPTHEIADAGPRDGAGALPTNYRSSFAKVNKSRLVSNGHAGGRWEIDVYANDVAQKALAARAKETPVGAIAVVEHYERSENQKGQAGPVMVMEKKAKGFSPTHGDWRWVVIGASGALVKEGVVDQCTGCHDDAPMDGLFPIVE